MTQSALTLLNPPIVEAVIDIHCDYPPNFDLSECEQQAKEAFSKNYPQHRQVFFQEHKIQQGEGTSPELSIRKGISAHQFLQADSKQLVQVRVGGYSFNRLAPYTSLDDYLPEMENTWNLYVGVAHPVQVKAISLRYINRILLPLESGAVDLDSYFQIGPRIPDEETLAMTGFLNQYQLTEKSTGNQVSTVLTSQQIEGGRLPVILDNTVSARTSCLTGDWSTIRGAILELRNLKNHIFEKALTQKCLDLFQQP